MSAPYGQQYGGQPSPYGDQQSFQDQQQQQPEGQAPPPVGAHVAETGKKKKRAYAADAFKVGSAGAGGQAPAPGQYGAPTQLAGAPAYGGYGAQAAPDAQDVQYGHPQQPGVGAPGGAPAAGGYGYPDYAYPGANAGAPGAGGVDAVTAGVANMGFTGAGQPAAPHQQPHQQVPAQQGQPPRTGPLNQLYPTDLMSQPFNVSELDLPPPPIMLPPNVRIPLASLLCLYSHSLIVC